MSPTSRWALADLHVASPCPASWEEMQGDDRVRFCQQCRLNVYNLSGMSRAEADTLVQQRQGRLCVRFYRRRDGTLLTQDCPVGLRAARRLVRRGVVLFAAVSAAILGGVVGWAAVSRDEDAPGNSPFRQIEPFATILEWLHPSPPPPCMGALPPISVPPETVPPPAEP
jgi:hypothetical protein